MIEEPGQATSSVSADEAITARPSGKRPLLMSGDALASLRARGVQLDPVAPLGRLIREDPEAIRGLYEAQIEAGVDVLCAVTWGTSPRALAPIGMSFRAAMLTGLAVDLALESSASVSRRIAVAGVLGHFPAGLTSAEADHIADDYATHATRMAAAGCEILVACGFDAESAVPAGLARLARRAAVVSAGATQLATWARIELADGYRTADGEALDDAIRAALDGGADTLLFDVDSAELGLGVLARLERIGYDGQVGFLVAASAPAPALEPPAEPAEPLSAEPGSAPAPESTPADPWVAAAMRLIDAGARILGGGAGTTVEHITSLSKVLREVRRVPAWKRGA